MGKGKKKKNKEKEEKMAEICEKQFDDGLISQIRGYQDQIEQMEMAKHRCIRLLMDKERDKLYSEMNLSYHQRGNNLL